MIKLRKLCYIVLCVGIVSANASFYSNPSTKGRRSPEQTAEETLFREETHPESGGKIPEAAHMRGELNRIDEMGFNNPAVPGMIAAMENMPLPDKMPENFGQSGHPNPHASAGHIHSDPYANPEHYAPDPYKTPAPYHPPSSYHEPAPYHPEPAYHEPESYHEPEPYHEPVAPYHPPADPYHPPSSYHEPEPYHPPTTGYHEPEPAYGPPPSDGYGAPHPYKPKGPVMLKERPYEPKEVKPVTITTHDTYTAFDCRKVPYPNRHYADPEAGCQIYHYCHADGKQDTFHCGYGTIFNEYLGTCDHSGAVYCKGGEGYAGPPAHPAHPVHPDPGYHNPEPSYHTQGHHAPEPHYSHPPAQYHHTEPAHHISGHSHHSPSAGFGSGFSFPKGFGGDF